MGDKKAGFSVFWADDGLDTGPILLQRECEVLPNDTVDTIYNRFLYPEGVKAMVCNYMPYILKVRSVSTLAYSAPYLYKLMSVYNESILP